MNDELNRINAEFSRKIEEIVSCVENFIENPHDKVLSSKLFWLCGWIEAHAEMKNKLYYAGQNKNLLQIEMIAEKMHTALFNLQRSISGFDAPSRNDMTVFLDIYSELIEHVSMDDLERVQ